MKSVRLVFMGLAFLSTAALSSAQEEITPEATTYKAELFGSVATGDETPFWMVSNRYGIVPLEANNGYLNAGVFHNQTFGKDFRWGAGLDVVAVVPRHHNFFIQQVYAEIGYKCLLLSMGSKERYTSLWDRKLSSGDLILSPNARPIPEVNISIPEFTTVPLTKGWMQIKGDFALGRSFDSGYLEDFVNDKQTYVKNVLWHHKSFYVQIKDTRGGSPLSGAIGVQHWAQWGGTSSNPRIGKQPQSLKDFLRVICGSEGGGDATQSDQINVLGNHYGSYDFKLTYTQPNWQVSAYYQHYFEDKSGMIFVNNTDGLWGAQLDLPKFPWLRKVVMEYLVTRDQSGQFHFIDFDHDLHPGVGGGGDDYYNNGEYTTGVSYFNRAIGSALIPSPEYNANGLLGFKNNRVRSWHLGTEGDLSPQVSYKFLLTVMNSWGRAASPFLEKRNSVSALVDISYQHPRLADWRFSGSLAADGGSMFGDNFGFSLKVAKRGILKSWK